jgi:hypothetical protein
VGRLVIIPSFYTYLAKNTQRCTQMEVNFVITSNVIKLRNLLATMQFRIFGLPVC